MRSEERVNYALSDVLKSLMPNVTGLACFLTMCCCATGVWPRTLAAKASHVTVKVPFRSGPHRQAWICVCDEALPSLQPV
jgi:hypothetical protein